MTVVSFNICAGSSNKIVENTKVNKFYYLIFFIYYGFIYVFSMDAKNRDEIRRRFRNWLQNVQNQEGYKN